MSKENRIDIRGLDMYELLTRYMQLVLEEEGSTFTDCINDTGFMSQTTVEFTEEEKKVLEEINNKVREKVYGHKKKTSKIIVDTGEPLFTNKN